MNRGFSLIELLVAFAICTGALVSAALLAYNFPRTVQAGYRELSLAQQSAKLLDQAVGSFPAAATNTNEGIASELHIDAFTDAAAIVTGSSMFGSQHVTFQALTTSPNDSRDSSCQPFLSGDWLHPRIVASYVLTPGALLPSSTPGTTYPISALAIQGDSLAVGVSTTTRANDPSLFFFRLSEADSKPSYIGAIDTAPASRVGVAALASGAGHIYAASGFATVSTTTCTGSPVSCAQLQIIDVSTIPTRIGFLQLGTVPASAIAYRAGYAYIGLVKGASGQEFQIVDVRNPQHPLRTGGSPVSRSVNAIATDVNVVYLATDDNASIGKAIIAFDTYDPAHPAEITSFRFPGAGFARSLALSRAHLFTGRTYATGISEEFSILSATSSMLTRIGGSDIGTSTAHRGVYAVLIRDFIAFLLAEHQLQLWNVTNPNAPVAYSSIDLPHGTATSFACYENTLYIGSIDTDGNGYLSTVTSS